MKLLFSEKKISGLLTILPREERHFLDEMANFNFSPARSLKLKEVMGYDKHRVVDGPVCVSDLAVFGMERLFATGKLKREEIDALILVTQSPDYFMPATSSVIQGRLGLGQDMFCVDINQGCAGFLVGLIQGFMLLDQPAIRKVVLINADVVSRKVSARDRNSYPLIGDAASITILERAPGAMPIHGNIKMDGTRRDALQIPAGGFRLPSDGTTAVLEEDAEGNFRAKDNLVMDGSAVFNFVLTEVPPMIDCLMQAAGATVGEIDAFLFHQPNRFMLHKLADKLGIPKDKMPSNIVENFGNASGVTIPLATTFNLGTRLLDSTMRVCLAGFGVGLTWSSMLMELGPLEFCEMIDYP
ncbi:MAG TPA: ketoacyl-ACP synthase III [Noviherbaspirillum sp.]